MELAIGNDLYKGLGVWKEWSWEAKGGGGNGRAASVSARREKERERERERGRGEGRNRHNRLADRSEKELGGEQACVRLNHHLVA